MAKRGYLILENGNIFEGESFGSDKAVDGEVVFNTGMVGYPEGFTDPSYFGQILTLTYPLIGNYGVPKKTQKDGIPLFLESDKIHIRGLIVSSNIENDAHWQADNKLSSWLKSEEIPALSGIDTRTLTKILRETGVMKGKIVFNNPAKCGVNFYDVNKDNLVASVSCKNPIIYGKGKLKILLIDCGLKYNQIRILLKHDTTIIRVPWDFDPFSPKNKIVYDAVFISNGPGDPKMVKKTISTVKKVIEKKIPILGICLGNQILALAAGANTYKLKYGHRSQNQPVLDNTNGKCFITTQNHGFAVDKNTLPTGWCPWFTNLNDGTNEGIRHTKFPFFTAQFHPEATPGPTDTEWIFEYFINIAKKWIIHN